MTKQIFSAFKVITLAVVLSFGLSYVYAWTTPSATPPTGNVSAPINTSATAQVMAGGLTFNTATSTTDISVNGITVGRGGGYMDSNTAVGKQSLYSNTTGQHNTANGMFSLFSNTRGHYNTANGDQSLYYNTTGIHNTANGAFALFSNTTGLYNTANGFQSLFSNTTGGANTANGYMALRSNTTHPGSYNTANGYQSLYFNTTGSANTANGASSLYSNTTGYNNVANGYMALRSNTTGYYNTASGLGSLVSNTTGSGNTANGEISLERNTTGNNNTAVGYGANVEFNDLTNATAIGAGAIASASNYVRIGNTAVTQIGGQVGWSALSDARQKENVSEYSHGLDFITKLRPVTYNLIDDKTKVTHSGFIAQEVEATNVPFYGLNKPANSRDFYSLNYAEFVVPLVNSIKELKAENDKLRADNEALRAEVKANNDALVARLEKLEAGK